MFLVTHPPELRHRKIGSFLPDEPVIAILLAAVDFEWTVRRAIIALGTNPNKFIRETVLSRCHGADDYKDAWKDEVKSHLGKGLPEIVPDWKFLKEQSFVMRHQVIHGVTGMPTSRKAQDRVEAFLAASRSITGYAASQETPIWGKRLPVRRKPRTL